MKRALNCYETLNCVWWGRKHHCQYWETPQLKRGVDQGETWGAEGKKEEKGTG